MLNAQFVVLLQRKRGIEAEKTGKQFIILLFKFLMTKQI